MKLDENSFESKLATRQSQHHNNSHEISNFCPPDYTALLPGLFPLSPRTQSEDEAEDAGDVGSGFDFRVGDEGPTIKSIPTLVITG